jgi:hypothetical protein
MAILTFIELMGSSNNHGKFRRTISGEISPETLADNPCHVRHLRIFVTN